jgi:hypothetical protein
LGSDFGQIRQGLSLCFIIMAFQAAYNKKFMHFMLFVLIGSCFHYSAIIVVPFYYLSRVQFTEKSCFLLFYFCIGCSTAFVFLFPFIVAMTNIPYLIEKFDLYGGQNIDLLGLLLSSLIKITLIVYYFREKNVLLKEKKQVFFFNLYIWGYGISLLFMQFPALSQRGVLFFEMMELILIPNIIKSIKKEEYFIYCMCIIFYTGLCIYRNIASYPESFIPYGISFDLRR